MVGLWVQLDLEWTPVGMSVRWMLFSALLVLFVVVVVWGVFV